MAPTRILKLVQMVTFCAALLAILVEVAGIRKQWQLLIKLGENFFESASIDSTRNLRREACYDFCCCCCWWTRRRRFSLSVFKIQKASSFYNNTVIFCKPGVAMFTNDQVFPVPALPISHRALILRNGVRSLWPTYRMIFFLRGPFSIKVSQVLKEYCHILNENFKWKFNRSRVRVPPARET